MSNKLKCHHCGDSCTSDAIQSESFVFCCSGCKTVFEILQQNQLSGYYDLENNPGVKITQEDLEGRFTFLDQQELRRQFIRFENERVAKVNLSVPQIHCSSCIWLLENLSRLNAAVLSSSVNFSARKLEISFSKEKMRLSALVELLSSIGYKPDLQSSRGKEKPQSDKRLYYQIGVAGFCFGNIMLFAFPEYLGMDSNFSDFRRFFGWLTLLLALPVFFYSGVDYLRNAISGVRQRFVNMDIPIALGMVALFVRSSFEIIMDAGSGYFDSLAGLIFFLLLGKWFQHKTYSALSFDRDYKSYFPIAVNRLEGDEIVPRPIEELKIGDEVDLRNAELLPADGLLLEQYALIDYSFVTGESDPVRKKKGDLIYAGGRIVGKRIRVKLTREVNNSYLTQLWNRDAFQKAGADQLNTLSNNISRYFTVIVLLITLTTAAVWYALDPSAVWNVCTSVLIVACPCALALSVPFTMGAVVRIMGRNGLYLKNGWVVESMAGITGIVFDKTGTLTLKGTHQADFKGDPLTDEEKNWVAALAEHSLHPLSISIAKSFQRSSPELVENFQEIPGEGLKGVIQGKAIRLGSSRFLGLEADLEEGNFSVVHLSIGGVYRGYFLLKQNYRKALKETIARLKLSYKTFLLSGDGDQQRNYLSEVIEMEHLRFEQTPEDKLKFIASLQDKGERVLMIGDGLNDAGALKQSDVGFAVSDYVHQFSPACDGILNGHQFSRIPFFLKLSKAAVRIVYFSFGIAFLYNVVGLSFAVSNQLTPIVAAILMPLSSISVVFFSTFSAQIAAKKVKI